MSKEIIIKTDRTTNYIYRNDKNSSVPIIFLHGFTGSHRSWDEVVEKLNYAAITLDLPGHGKSVFNDLSADYNLNDWCEDFVEILDSLELDKLNLCGYSMGGRLAIAFASKYPQKINRLILESTSYGIESKEKRAERFQKDLDLCNLIEKDFPKFVQKWEKNPLFNNQSKRNKIQFKRQREDRGSHIPVQLSKALKVFSQGKMKSYQNEFSKFKFPILIINGSEDLKYLKIAKEMTKLNENVRHYIISNSIHKTHLENPDAFVDILKNITS